LTVGIIVIGNEILSGKVADTNSAFLARELRVVGADLRRVVVIPDEVGEIETAVRDFRDRFDVVITSGGIGPTHDDVTVLGVATALGRRKVTHAGIEQGLRRVCGAALTPAHLKMAEIPEGAELVAGEDGAFPIIKVENVYLLPGIPQILERKFQELKPRFSGAPFHLKTVYSAKGESAIAQYLDSTLDKFPDLLLGSYPKIGDPSYMVKVTLESRDQAYVEAAFAHFVGLLPEGTVVRTEG